MLQEVQELVFDVTSSLAADLSAKTFDVASAILLLELVNFQPILHRQRCLLTCSILFVALGQGCDLVLLLFLRLYGVNWVVRLTHDLVLRDSVLNLFTGRVQKRVHWFLLGRGVDYGLGDLPPEVLLLLNLTDDLDEYVDALVEGFRFELDNGAHRGRQ